MTDQDLEPVARAICCGTGPCHVEEIKKREGGKYLMDLPCYAKSPDVISHARAAMAADPSRKAMEEALASISDVLGLDPDEEYRFGVSLHLTGSDVAKVRAALARARGETA